MNAPTIAVIAVVSLLFAAALRSTLRHGQGPRKGSCGSPPRCDGCKAHCPMATGKRGGHDSKGHD